MDAVQPTHKPFEVSQCGVAGVAVQLESPVQGWAGAMAHAPADEQTRPPTQSAFARHCTQVLSAVLQRGVLPRVMQSALVAQ